MPLAHACLHVPPPTLLELSVSSLRASLLPTAQMSLDELHGVSNDCLLFSTLRAPALDAPARQLKKYVPLLWNVLGPRAEWAKHVVLEPQERCAVSNRTFHVNRVALGPAAGCMKLCVATSPDALETRTEPRRPVRASRRGKPLAGSTPADLSSPLRWRIRASGLEPRTIGSASGVLIFRFKGNAAGPHNSKASRVCFWPFRSFSYAIRLVPTRSGSVRESCPSLRPIPCC